MPAPAWLVALFNGGNKMLKRCCLSVFLFALIGLTISPACFAQDQSADSIIPEGTEIQLALLDPVSSKLSEPGDEIRAVVRRDVVVDGRRLLREGTEVVGRVTLAQAAKRPLKGGRLRGSSSDQTQRGQTGRKRGHRGGAWGRYFLGIFRAIEPATVITSYLPW